MTGNDNEPVSPYAEMPVAQLYGQGRDASRYLWGIVHDNEIIARCLVFEEFQFHTILQEDTNLGKTGKQGFLPEKLLGAG
jgi:hypothetical protein